MLCSNRYMCPHGCEIQMPVGNFLRHLRRVHHYSDDQIQDVKVKMKSSKATERGTGLYRCNICEHPCSSKRGIESHIRQKHRIVQDPQNISLFDQSVISHEKKYRRDEEDYEELASIKSSFSNKKTPMDDNDCEDGVYACPDDGCTTKFNSRKCLIAHLEQFHNENYLEKAVFPSYPEFSAWNEICSMESCSTFSKKGSYTTGILRKTSFRCHREGKHLSKATIRRNHTSKKVTGDKRCSAFLEVTENLETGEVTVIGSYFHVGHDLKISLQRMTEGEKDIISSMIESGVSSKLICSNLSKEYGDTSRLGFVTSDDIRQVRISRNLVPGKLADNDVESLSVRYRRNSKDDGIRLFNPPLDSTGAGFQLVLITPGQCDMLRKYSNRMILLDDTHCITKYSLKLTTIIVADGRDRGIPVGFLLSSSTTSSDVSVLFSEVRKLYPEFRPRYLISDEAYSFINGFKSVFPNSPTKHILCRWHVLKTWSRKLSELVTENEKNDIMGLLEKIIREPSRIELDIRINSLLHMLENGSVGMKKFADYYRKFYLSKIEEWSTVDRLGAPAYTTMFAESWHSMLKREVLATRVNIRADNLVQKLIEGFQWIMQKNARQVARNLAKCCPRKVESEKQCHEAKKSKNDYLIEERGSEFVVTNIAKNKSYVIRDSMCCQCEEQANVHCPSCHCCPYRFSCTCLLQLSGVSCAHVHLVIQNIGEMRTIFEPESEVIVNNDEFEPFQNIEPPRKENVAAVESRISCRNANDEEMMKLTKIENIFNMIHQEIRSKIKNGSPDATSLIDEVLESLTNIKDKIPAKCGSIPVRRDHNRKPLTSRDAMNGFVKMKPRTKRKTVRKASNVPSKLSRKEISICNVCKMCDPQLPSDIDSDEEENRITLWKKCEGCTQYVHLTCAMTNKNCTSCGGNYIYCNVDDSDSSDYD